METVATVEPETAVEMPYEAPRRKLPIPPKPLLNPHGVAPDPSPEQAAVAAAEGSKETEPEPILSYEALTPAQLLLAAEQARLDATGYVAWKNSKTENIDRLTALTLTLNASIIALKTTSRDGVYLEARLMEARAALRNLRDFLATKGD